MTLWRLETLFPEEMAARLRTCPILVLPFGTIEWHSHHLPLGLDGLVAQAIGEGIAERSEAVLAPVSYWAADGVPFPYTLRLSSAQIEPLLVATFEQFAAMGFQVIVAFTGHFGLEQTLALKRAALTVMDRSSATVLPLTEYDVVTDLYVGDHAALGETSLLWALRPDLVRLESVAADQPLPGIIGPDPRGAASPEFGRQLLDTIAQRTADVATRLLEHTTAVERMEWIEALRVTIRVLEKTAQQRATRPKQEVPGLTTTAYLAACDALVQGDYRTAKKHLEIKLADLTA